MRFVHVLGVVSGGVFLTAGSALAGGTAPHGGGVAPTEDASHACPALERKFERAKDADEAARFKDQLIFHGCLSCDDSTKAFVEYYEKSTSFTTVKGNDDVLATDRILYSMDEKSRLAYLDQGYYDAVFAVSTKIDSSERENLSESDYELERYLITARVSDQKAVDLVSSIAANECIAQVRDDLMLIGCSASIGEQVLAFNADCYAIEKGLIAETRK